MDLSTAVQEWTARIRDFHQGFGMQVEALYDPISAPEPLADRRGTPLPAFLVMERGESLSDWSDRAKPDLFQSIAVRTRFHHE